MSMKASDRDRLKLAADITAKLEAEGAKGPEMALRPKHLIEATFKFGAKKRKASNSGGTGRAGRRAKRNGRR